MRRTRHGLVWEPDPSTGWLRGIYGGILLIVGGTTLWLFDEFVAPHRVLPDRLSFLGSRGPSSWLFGSVALAGFPVRITDPIRARACVSNVAPPNPRPLKSHS